jgi:hypothetical protein
MCPSSEELTVPMGHWYFSLWNKWTVLKNYKFFFHKMSQKILFTNQCLIDTVSSRDDGHIVARNMYRSWNKYTKK